MEFSGTERRVRGAAQSAAEQISNCLVLLFFGALAQDLAAGVDGDRGLFSVFCRYVAFVHFLAILSLVLDPRDRPIGRLLDEGAPGRR